MEPAEPARFRPTRRQAFGRGLYFGSLASVVGLTASVLTATTTTAWYSPEPPGWVWPLLAFGPPVLGALAGVLLAGRLGADVSAGGIRVSAFARGVQPWSRVVDLRAERRGARTVVSVYFDTGASVQLAAPYSGELFASDPQFELKVFALSHLWRTYRFGGLPT